MAEYKLSYTANEIDEKLGKIDELIAADSAILEAAKAYSDSKGGYTKETAPIAFNGDTNGKETFVDASEGLSLVKISNKVYDFSSVTKVVVHVRETAEEGEYPIGEIVTFGGVSLIAGAAGEGIAFSTDGTVESMSFLSPGTWVSSSDTGYVTRIEFAETIVPIDPKYLPNKVVDFDQLGLTAPILELFNKGGGAASVVDGDVSVAKVIADAFPLDGNYVAKSTIPDIGTMYIKPVLTTFEEGKFIYTHLDSYLFDAGTNTLTKFYARVAYGTNIVGGENNTIRVTVGFYT